MRFFTFIFTFYILTLSCMPCRDHDDCKIGKVEQSNFESTSNSNHNQDTENCSPFCICACCSQSCNFMHLQNEISFISHLPFEMIIEYHSPIHIGVSASIWQPPKIS